MDIRKLTKEQAIIISGFTGILCGEFYDFHADVEKRLGRGVQTFEFGIKSFITEVKKLYEADFIELATVDNGPAKAQAVPEQDQQVWATNNLTWKDIAFRALSCKVLKTTQNWVHVKNIACVGSTTASLICRKLGVDPDGTKFELIEAQESAND